MSAETDVGQDALGDSEATVRQAETVLTDLGQISAGLPNENRANGGTTPPAKGFLEFIQTLIRTYLEMGRVVETLRASRGLLEQAASSRLQQTHKSLVEVSSATKTAATGILDGLDRALELVDHLHPGASGDVGDSAGPEDPNNFASQLRDELHEIMGHVQFQDITAQQLGHSCRVLMDIESRLIALSDFFDIRGLDLDELTAASASFPVPYEEEEEPIEESCDPGASTLNVESRQTVADEVFTKG